MSRRILTIDDTTSTLIVVKTSIEVTTNWEVISAESGIEGLLLAETEQPDVILLDVIMSGLTGIEVFHRLKSNSHTQNIPIIFFTVMAEKSERKTLEALDVAGVITKPFEPEALANEIKRLLHWH